MSGMPSWLGAIAKRAVAASTKLTDIAARLFGGASRKFRREDPEAREAWFATVVDRLSQGLVVFDKDRRVVLCNARYREIYGMETDQVAPGTPTSELIKRRLKLWLKVPDMCGNASPTR